MIQVNYAKQFFNSNANHKFFLDDLLKARQIAKKVEVTSEFTDSEESTQRRRKPRRVTSSSDEDDNSIHPRPPIIKSNYVLL